MVKWIVGVIAAMLATTANSQGIGNMRCEVKSVSSVFINEGKPVVSNESLFTKAGSKFELMFKANDEGSFFFNLRDGLHDQMYVSGFFDSHAAKKEKDTNSEIVYLGSTSQLRMDDDYFEFLSSIGDQLRLNRYHKDDWQGIYQSQIMGALRSSPLYTNVFTLDCRSHKGSFSETLAFLRENLR